MWCLWLRTGGSDNCALLLATVATNFPQGSLGFSLLMCVNSVASRERWKFESQELCNTLYTAHTHALLMGVTNLFLKRVVNQLCALLNGLGLTLVSSLLHICLCVNWFPIYCTRLLTLRRLMSYIYMEHPFLMFLDHTQRRSTVGRTPLDE